MIFTISADNGDHKNVVSKVIYQWTRNILEMTGIDWEDCFPDDNNPDSLNIFTQYHQAFSAAMH